MGLTAPAHTNIRLMRRPPPRPDDGGKVTCPGLGDIWCPGRAEIHMSQTARFQEILRGPWVMDPKTAALVQMGALVAIGSPAVCLEWGVSRALAAGATEDEITDVLLAVAPAAGLGRVVGATVGVADGLGYDVQAALLDPDDR